MSKLSTGTYEKYSARYATLTLTDGACALTVTPEKGGMATSFTKDGEEYLWLRDKNFESTDRPRCGIPILFPSCSKPEGGVHIFGGAAYPIEIHGFADLLPWQVAKADDEAIELTLTPNAAAQAEPPQLTLGTEPPAAPGAEEKKEVEPVKIDESMLTEEERKMVDDFSKKIDITDTQLVLQYGSAAQKSVASFSESALSSVRTKDLGEVGDTLSDLVVELKDFGEEEDKGGIFGFFKKAGNKMETMKAQYSKAEANVEKITRELEQHQVRLMKEIGRAHV